MLNILELEKTEDLHSVNLKEWKNSWQYLKKITLSFHIPNSKVFWDDKYQFFCDTPLDIFKPTGNADWSSFHHNWRRVKILWDEFLE